MEDVNKDMPATDKQVLNEQPKNPSSKPKKSHKKRTILVALALVFTLFIVTPILVAGYFGFIPIISTIMGAKQAKDLGVTYTQQDYTNYLAKTKTNLQNFNTAPINPDYPTKKIVFADPVEAQNLIVTQEELTAAINESEWVWMPIDNAQVKLTNSIVEISGNLKLDNITNFINFIGGVGYSQADLDNAIGWAKPLVNNSPIYIKAEGSVLNNQLSLNVQEVQVGRYSVPVDIAQTVLSSGTQSAINRTPGLNAQNATLVDGALQFSGTHPTTIYVKTN